MLAPTPDIPNPSGQPDPKVRVIAPKLNQAIWFCSQRGWNPKKHVASTPMSLLGHEGLIIFVYEGDSSWTNWHDWWSVMRGRRFTLVEWGSDKLDRRIEQLARQYGVLDG